MASALPIRELTVILARFGCRNRPFYKIVVIKSKIKKADWDIVEQVGETFFVLSNSFRSKFFFIIL